MAKAKQVIVMRTDVMHADAGLRVGKMCGQAGHSVMMAIQSLFVEKDGSFVLTPTPAVREWLTDKLQAKIVVEVKSEQELRDIYQKAVAAGLPASFVVDSGKTVFNHVPTPTAVAIGPAWSHEIDLITGTLPLLK